MVRHAMGKAPQRKTRGHQGAGPQQCRHGMKGVSVAAQTEPSVQRLFFIFYLVVQVMTLRAVKTVC